MKNLFTLMQHAFERKNPKSIILTCLEDVKKNAGNLKKLNSEEREMLTEYILRTEIKKIHGSNSDANYGVTVGKAIEMQREFAG